MRIATAVSAALLLLSCGCDSDRPPLRALPPPDAVARYTVTFAATWSAATHPQDFPASAHFSGLIGATHSGRVEFWRPGRLASAGIQAMAELGSKSPLDAEVAAAIAAGSAGSLLSGDGLSPSPGQVSLDFEISLAHPLVTLVTMIAPSPDWFVGVAGLPLLQGGEWVDSLAVELYGWDAGTDNGASYTSPNAPAMPHEPIAPLVGPPFEAGGQAPRARLDIPRAGTRSATDLQAGPSLGTFTFVRR
jgi:hypothetical protein